MHMRIPRAVLAVLAALLLSASVPLSALAYTHFSIGRHHLQSAPGGVAFEFGGVAGLMPSWDVKMYNNGTVGVTGCARLADPSLHLTVATLRGLLKLAEAARFFALPRTISGSPRATDVQQGYIAVTTTSGTKTVTVIGAHNARYVQLWSVLAAVTGVTPQQRC